MSTGTETRTFQAEVEELLDLMIHSLYSHKEIFLRELLSNASDALDKLRFEALTRPELLESDASLRIRLEVEPSRRLLRVIDDGIGMSRDEVVENLGTIARSGTKRFLEAVREKSGSAVPQVPQLIGQFGVGFYSSFMVADEISVETRRAGETRGTRWVSRGKGEYSVEEIERNQRGTMVELHLRPLPTGEEEAQDFADPERLRALVRRYSDFVEYPIEIAAAHFKGDPELRPKSAADGIEVVVLNSMKPLWARAKDEITPAEHAEFYKHLTHSWEAPLEVIHFKAEGASEYTALLYIPSERALEAFDPERERSHVHLYVRRVFVMADCEELLPPWLRFVRGVVDSADLPLNVSREILQHDRAVAKIEKRLVRKVLETLATMLKERRADYERFWKAFGPVLKEGIVLEPEQASAIAALLLYPSSRGEELTTLDEYVARMPESQKDVYLLAGEDRRALERSPHLEALARQGSEVLYFVDPVDEWVLERVREHGGHALRAIDRGELALEAEEKKLEREQKERELRPLLEALEERLRPEVERVRFSSRLTDSAAVLVDDERALGATMEKILRRSGGEPPKRKRALELNPGHPVVDRLRELFEKDPRSPRLEEFAHLLHGQALLAEGSPLPDPVRFSKLVNELLVAAR